MARPVKTMIGRQGTLRVDPTLAAWLGELTARWSFLEWLLARLLATLTGMDWDHASAVIYAVNATSARTDIIRLIAERMKKGDAKRTKAIQAVTLVGSLTARRNAYIHHMWFSETDTKKVYTFDYRSDINKPQGITKRQTVKALKGFCDEIADACQLVAEVADVKLAPAFIADLKMPLTMPSARTSAKG